MKFPTTRTVLTADVRIQTESVGYLVLEFYPRSRQFSGKRGSRLVALVAVARARSGPLLLSKSCPISAPDPH